MLENAHNKTVYILYTQFFFFGNHVMPYNIVHYQAHNCTLP